MADAKRSKLGIVCFRLVAPSPAVAQVIGKSGETINRIRASSGAEVSVDDFTASRNAVFTFVGPSDACEVAIMDVWAQVQQSEARAARENPYVALTEDGKALARQTLRMLIADHHAGGIIGTGGEQVRELRATHGAQVTVQSGKASSSSSSATSALEAEVAANGERVVTIAGPPDAVQAARRDVWERVCGMEAPRRQGRGARPKAGTLSGGSASQTASVTAEPPRAPESIALAPITGVPVLHPTPSSSSSSLSSSSSADGSSCLVSEPLEVPVSLTGRLIGRGGSTIDAIRRQSGCSVVVSRDSVAELLTGSERSETNVVTVVGTLERLAVAKDLMARALAGEVIAVPQAGVHVMPTGTAVPGFVSAGITQKG